MEDKIKILLVEDDDLFRTTIKRSLLKKNCEVSEASDGKIAKTAMLLQKFDLVISDIQMPFLTGIELLEWIKQNQPTPVVLMTGFSQVLETKKAHEIGADGFLAKPFKEVELFEIVERYTNKNVLKEPEATTDLDQAFCKISMDNFLSEKESEFDVYLRISNTKYIKISHTGGKISEDRVRSYKEKGLNHVYVKKGDFSKIVKFNLQVAKVAKSSAQINPEKKANFIKHTGELILENAFVNGVNPDSFKEAKDFVEMSMDVLADDQQVFSILNALSEHDDFLYAHSLAVSTFSVMIGRALGWTTASTHFKLSLGGLFHDIGKKEIEKEVLEKPRALLSQKERAKIESHTTRGKEILQSLQSMPPDIAIIAYEHHEDSIGQGYPRGIAKNEIHPLARVVSVANVFCEYAVKCRPDVVPISGAQAISTMSQLRSENLDKEAFTALKSLFSNPK